MELIRAVKDDVSLSGFAAIILRKKSIDYKQEGKTALMWACCLGRESHVRMLIQAGAKLNLKDSRSRNALMYAACHNHTRCLSLLIDNGAKLNHRDHIGQTAIMLAAENGSCECLELLISRGANMRLLDNLDRSVFLHAVASGRLDCVNLTIKNGAWIRAYSLDGNAINIAAANKRHELMKELFKMGINPTTLDEFGSTAAITAATVGSLECLKLIIEEVNSHQEYLNIQNTLGFSALMAATLSRHHGCLNALIDEEVQLDLQDIHSRTALMYADLNSIKILIEAGANAEIRDVQGRTVLISNIMLNKLEEAELLIRLGVNLEAADGDGYTPLMHAVMKSLSNFDAICLVELMVQKRANLNVVANGGVNALQLASRSKHVSQILLEAGADYKSCNSVYAQLYAANKQIEVLKEQVLEMSLMPGGEEYLRAKEHYERTAANV